MASRVDHPVIGPGHTFATVTDKISSLVLTTKTPIGWFVGFGIAFLLLQLFLGTVTLLLAKGVGIWGVNVPVGWGFDIINFVWWIGIGHAGTLISAILLLFRQQWRTSINRFAEAMTLFAVACAGMFPILHMGRPWVGAYWLMPYPNTMGLWPNFRSPLIWVGGWRSPAKIIIAARWQRMASCCFPVYTGSRLRTSLARRLQTSDPVSSCMLCQVQCVIRQLDKPREGKMLGYLGCRHTQADGDCNGHCTMLECLLYLHSQPFCGRQRLHVVGLGQEHDELFTAIPTQQIHRA